MKYNVKTLLSWINLCRRKTIIILYFLYCLSKNKRAWWFSNYRLGDLFNIKN